MTYDITSGSRLTKFDFGEDAETYWRDALVTCDRCGYREKFCYGTIVMMGEMPDEEIFSEQWAVRQLDESLRENGWSIRDDSASDYCARCVDAKISR